MFLSAETRIRFFFGDESSNCRFRHLIESRFRGAVPSKETTSGLKVLNEMQNSGSHLLNVIPAAMDQPLELVSAVELPKLVRKSSASDPVCDDHVRFSVHRKTAGEDFEEEGSKGEDVVAARLAADRFQIRLESVAPMLNLNEEEEISKPNCINLSFKMAENLF